jgi:hypothetical protein
MAYFEWEVSSITSVRFSAADIAAGFYYGTMYGVKGYWVKLPNNAPPIGSITLAAAVKGEDGLYTMYGSTSAGGALTDCSGWVVTARTIVSYERGGRWINIGAYGSSIPVSIGTGARRKMMRLYYRSVNEYVGPTA